MGDFRIPEDQTEKHKKQENEEEMTLRRHSRKGARNGMQPRREAQSRAESPLKHACAKEIKATTTGLRIVSRTLANIVSFSFSNGSVGAGVAHFLRRFSHIVRTLNLFFWPVVSADYGCLEQLAHLFTTRVKSRRNGGKQSSWKTKSSPT